MVQNDLFMQKAFLFTALLSLLSTLLYGQLTVTPTSLPDAVYGTAYNQPITVTGGTSPYTFSALGIIPPGISVSSDGIISGTPTAVGALNAFTVTVQDAVGATALQVYNLAVDQAPLIITPDDKTMTYGGTLPALTLSYSGFVNGDGPSSLLLPATASTTANSASPPGTYSITAGGALSLNYSITYGTGTLTIGKAPLTITANAASSVYGAPLAAANALTVTYSGFVNSDNASSLTTQPTVDNSAIAGSAAGSYVLTPGGAASNNYSFIYVNGVYTISRAPLTITADSKTMTYGGTVPALTATYSGFVNGDAVGSLNPAPTITTTATSTSTAGSYPITAAGAVDPNYAITYVAGTMTVGKVALTITANAASSVYGAPLAASSALTVGYSGFVNGDGPANLTTLPTVANSAVAGAAAGTYVLTPSGASSPNYTFTYVNGVYTITKAALTVTADNKSMALGGPLPALTITYTGFVNGDAASSLTTQPTVSTAATASSGAGTYAITVTGAASPNYTFSYVNGLLTVGKAVLTITANSTGSIYGAPVTSGSALTVTYSGFVNGDGPGSLTAQPIVTNAAATGAHVGTYALTPSGASSPNYTITYVNGTYTIIAAPLTIAAVSQTMPYGGPVPALTASYSGFVNGDNAASLTTQPTLTTTATVTSPTGTYPINISGAVDPNYTITYSPGTMAVGKAILTITADSKAMPLGGPLPTLTVSYAGFVNGDNSNSLTTPPSLTVQASASSPAGSYPITASGAVDPNYTFVYVPGVLAIGKALLTITVNPANSVYGAALVPNSSLTFSYAGFVNGDGPGNLTQAPTATNTAVAGSPVGNYALIPSGAQSNNYVINYVNGTYTITPAPLTITPTSLTMNYGGPVPALTASFSGFVNGDNAASLTSQPSLTTTATTASPVGIYPINAVGAVDPNYTIAYTPGTMTVQRATLTVTPNSASMIYGSALPALTASYSGFVNGDNVSTLIITPSISTTATASSPAGTYPIIASGGVSTNYSFVYNPGTLTINPASLHVTANAATKTYGSQDPNFTYTVSGYLNGDNTSIFSGSLGRTPGEDVGTYPITLGTLSAGGNYTIVFTGNELTITIGSQKIAWTQRLIVGCNTVTQIQLTATASSGLPVSYSVSDPTVASVSGNTLTLLTPGTAIVTATQAGDANYAAAPAALDTVYYQSASLIRQRWNDVIFFDNSSGDYVQWQWYKNGDAVAGATDPYYSESPSLNGQYFVIATNKDSQQVQSCVLTIAPGATIPGGIKVFPNPATPGGMVTIACNYTSSDLQGAVLQIIDLNGRVQQQITTVQPSMQVAMPSGTGTYIINLLLSGGQKTSVNVLVMPH